MPCQPKASCPGTPGWAKSSLPFLLTGTSFLLYDMYDTKIKHLPPVAVCKGQLWVIPEGRWLTESKGGNTLMNMSIVWPSQERIYLLWWPLGSERTLPLGLVGTGLRALKSSSSHLGQFCPEEAIFDAWGRNLREDNLQQLNPSGLSLMLILRAAVRTGRACWCVLRWGQVLQPVSAQPLLSSASYLTHIFFLLLFKNQKGKGGEGKSLGIWVWGAPWRHWHSVCIERF